MWRYARNKVGGVGSKSEISRIRSKSEIGRVESELKNFEFFSVLCFIFGDFVISIISVSRFIICCALKSTVDNSVDNDY